MNKKIIISSLVLAALVGAGSKVVTTTHAQESNSIPPMVEKLAERFNINQNEVESFFEEQREEHRAEMEAKREEALNTAVSEGKITEAQKNAILAKMEENKPNRETMQNLSREERDAQREEHRSKMEAWAKDNGIDLSVLDLGRGGPENGRYSHRGLRGM